MRLTRATTAALLALSLAGCGLSLTTEPRVQNRCIANADCADAVCDLELGMCVTEAGEPLRIGLEVTPPEVSGDVSAATHSLGPFEVDGVESLPLVLPAPIKVIGTVRVPGMSDPVGATIRFTRPGAFVGARRVEVETTTGAMPFFAEDGAEADYETELVADREYTVTVTPLGDWVGQLPPLRFQYEVPSGGDGFIVRKPILYPEELVELKGLVVNSMELPAMGRSVWVVDAESGRRLSSTATTSAEPGEEGQFRVLMSPGVENYRIRIGTGEDTSSPTIYADPSYLILDEDGFVQILVPMIRPVCYRGSVELGQTGEVAEGAIVTFSTDEVLDPETGLAGTFETMLTAQEDGSFEASLLPGSYDVLVTPPPDHEVSRYGVLHESSFQIMVDETGPDCLMGQLFILPERAAVGGVVRTADERLMGDAVVTAAALNLPLEELPAALYNRTGQTTTDPRGQFNLPLDIGVYDLFIKPPAESNFPWVVDPGLEVGASEETYSDVYQVSAPLPVTGTLRDVAGAIPGAEIRAFAVVTDEDGTERNVAVGRTIVDETGEFTLLLPARL